eukprot:3933500-Alexandrium_andersonii.AAC.1
MDPVGRGDDRSRSPTPRGPLARQEAPHSSEGAGPECGLGARVDIEIVFSSMNRAERRGPGESAHARKGSKRDRADSGGL